MERDTNKLPEDFKARWIAALRSGEYKQGRGSLYKEYRNEYCCLGVAGAVCGLSKDILDGKGFFYKDAAPREYPRLLVEDIDTRNMLMDMNDNNFSFNEIADYIEKNL